MKKQTYPIQFAEDEAEQSACFCISLGWTGGHGEAVIDLEHRILRFGPKELPTYISGKSEKLVMEQVELPSCIVGQALIWVSADIRLEERRSRNTSIPGMPEEAWTALDILQLHDVKWEATPCP